MRRPALFALPLWVILASLVVFAQMGGDQLGTHDLTPSSQGPVKGSLSNACLYCHAPHGAMSSPTPLWNQKLSMQTYNFYSSTTYHQTATQPGLNSPSKLCLSCHDGTVAPGQTVLFGQIPTTGNMKSTSVFGTDLKSSHPFSLQTPLVDSPNVNVQLFGNPGQTADPKVRLINGTIECTTCHEPHFQNIDKALPLFLVRDSSNSQLCLACHDPQRVVNGQTNYLAGWAASSHALAANTTSNAPYVGGYGTVAQNGCNSCHMPHNASGPLRLLRGPNEQDCAACHAGTNLQPAILNVFAEFAKPGSHPAPASNNLHDRAEATLLNSNRHATCADCHNPHASQPGAFNVPPAVRSSQIGATGISAVDGTTVLNPAVNQYETCLRCHGTSAGKSVNVQLYGYLPTRLVASGDPLDVIPQFALTATSSHPVTHDRSSVLAQPSLLSQMLQLDGTTPGRVMGTRIFCSDCHNADDNREFGGSGPNGPHGSKWTHILERRYEMSQAASPGGPVTNLFPNPDLTAAGPYALCGKCHDLNQIVSNTSFAEHRKHIVEKGFSCSVCHTAHGMGGTNANVSGERLVNFDIAVVAANGGTPITYNRTAGTCALVCHGQTHGGGGAPVPGAIKKAAIR